MLLSPKQTYTWFAKYPNLKSHLFDSVFIPQVAIDDSLGYFFHEMNHAYTAINQFPNETSMYTSYCRFDVVVNIAFVFMNDREISIKNFVIVLKWKPLDVRRTWYSNLKEYWP